PSAAATALKIDELLLEEFGAAGIEPTGIVNDEDFLRRAYLDLAGRIPNPSEIVLFGLDPSPEKRASLINRLLESDEFASLWASYWRDVIFNRATEARSRLVQPAFEAWMTDQLADNRPWDEITRELLTATGSVNEVGETGLIFAHTGDPAELAAEVSRIFLGIQMSCANCHDHPTDSWTREQFHQLAAYFPRITVRRTDPGDPRSFEVSSMEGRGRGRRNPGNFDPERIVRLLDRNRNGKLSKQEARGPLAQRFDELLARLDVDKDRQLSIKEFAEARALMNQQPGRGSEEYYMPDLDNPTSQGTMMQPVFFVPEVNSRPLRSGADDQMRRNALADLMTSRANPWFSRAFVNRIWAELTGTGFYMPIDDMGPERFPQHEQVLDTLAQGFARSGYNVRWLYQTIMLTNAYQRQLDPNADELGSPAFAAASATRLRSDQVYASLTQTLGIEGAATRAFAAGMSMRGRMRGPSADPGRRAFSELFGFDPSTPREDLIGTVPQALFMMNSPIVDALTQARGDTKLARILNRYDDDADAISELYLMALSREPTARETEINLAHIREIGDRREAFEDILWSLLNSTERFLRNVSAATLAAGSLNFHDLLSTQAAEMRKNGRALILLWMAGGPSQFETFDPKPNHENGGGTRVIDTSIPGVQIAEDWPEMARVMDRVSLIRSMTNKEGNHQRASYQMHTGYIPSGSVKHPLFGSAVAQQLDRDTGELPSVVSIGPTLGAGFLGVDYEPFVVNNPGQMPQNVASPVPDARLTRRVGRLEHPERQTHLRASRAGRRVASDAHPEPE
ncbi:EF-hand domain-containing protein, partial [Durusdinium trenchii]